MKREMVVGLFSIVTLLGCSNPCSRLYDKVCADLGPDCELFSTDKSIYESVMPRSQYLRKGELAGCEMLLAEENYDGYTLPTVEYRIAAHKTPGIPAPTLPDPVMPDGFFAGFSSLFLYLLPIVVIGGILLYTRKPWKRPS